VAVWTSYDRHGKLLAEAVHAAGTVFSGTKLVLAALWTLRGFARPADVQQQASAIAAAAHRSVRDKPIYYK
jgi:hypothetical protein